MRKLNNDRGGRTSPKKAVFGGNPFAAPRKEKKANAYSKAEEREIRKKITIVWSLHRRLLCDLWGNSDYPVDIVRALWNSLPGPEWVSQNPFEYLKAMDTRSDRFVSFFRQETTLQDIFTGINDRFSPCDSLVRELVYSMGVNQSLPSDALREDAYPLVKILYQTVVFPLRVDLPGADDGINGLIQRNNVCRSSGRRASKLARTILRLLCDDTFVDNVRYGFSPEHGPGSVAFFTRHGESPEYCSAKLNLAQKDALVNYPFLRELCRNSGMELPHLMRGTVSPARYDKRTKVSVVCNPNIKVWVDYDQVTDVDCDHWYDEGYPAPPLPVYVEKGSEKAACYYPMADAECVPRLLSVPKSWKTKRVICVNAVTKMFFQKGVFNGLLYAMEHDPLWRRHVDLRDADKNAAMARKGSITKKWATIDQSAASDNISWDFCQSLFSGVEPLLKLLTQARDVDFVYTPSDRQQSIRRRLSIAFLMGNAACFPVLTIVNVVVQIEATLKAHNLSASAFATYAMYSRYFTTHFRRQNLATKTLLERRHLLQEFVRRVLEEDGDGSFRTLLESEVRRQEAHLIPCLRGVDAELLELWHLDCVNDLFRRSELEDVLGNLLVSTVNGDVSVSDRPNRRIMPCDDNQNTEIVKHVILVLAFERSLAKIAGIVRKTLWGLRGYGDDVTVCEDAMPDVFRLFDQYGFAINRRKTFHGQSPYRESCGHEYYNGYEITPLRIPRTFSTLTVKRENASELCALANSAYEHSFLRVWNKIRLGYTRLCFSYPLLSRTGRYGLIDPLADLEMSERYPHSGVLIDQVKEIVNGREVITEIPKQDTIFTGMLLAFVPAVLTEPSRLRRNNSLCLHEWLNQHKHPLGRRLQIQAAGGGDSAVGQVRYGVRALLWQPQLEKGFLLPLGTKIQVTGDKYEPLTEVSYRLTRQGGYRLLIPEGEPLVVYDAGLNEVEDAAYADEP